MIIFLFVNQVDLVPQVVVVECFPGCVHIVFGYKRTKERNV